MLPIILLLLFRYMFGGAIATGGLSYINYVMAGLIVISLAFNSTATAVGVADDMRSGIVERFRSMPLLGSAMLIGHVVGACCATHFVRRLDRCRLRGGLPADATSSAGWPCSASCCSSPPGCRGSR